MKPFAEIWHATVEDVLNAFPDHTALSEDEKERKEKFLFEKDKRALLAAHILKRNMLSKFANLAPNEWLFEKGPYGRPEIKKGLIDTDLFFNISHRPEAVCCLVSNIPECGVDLENNDRKVDWEDISKKVFTPSEIKSCSREGQRFRNLWCLKEAYMKATGLGFNMDPVECCFIMDDISVSLENHPRWKFELKNFEGEYTMAVAIHCSEEIEIQFRKMN